MSKDYGRQVELQLSSPHQPRSPRLTSLTADLEKVQAVVADLQRQIDEERTRLSDEARRLLQGSGELADRQDAEPT